MTDRSDTARAWADVDLGALQANARTITAVCGSRLLPMVKANGYGLGAVAVTRALESLNPWGYGVASVDEGIGLRAAGVRRPILVFSPLDPVHLELYLTHELRPTVCDPGALGAWCASTARPFHIEIDTGMSRTGVRWDDRAALGAIRDRVAAALGWEGVFTHFHSAETDPASLSQQWQRFHAVLAAMPRRPGLVHAANSAAALKGHAYAADLVRPGIFLYGGAAGDRLPEPVVSLRARVIGVRRLAAGDTVSYGATWRAERPTTIATLAIGYADGLLRGDQGTAGSPARRPRLIQLGDRTVPLVGRVTMDMCMIAVDDGAVAVGHIATIYGGLVSLDDQAKAAGTISYELLTALGPRVPRRYRRG